MANPVGDKFAPVEIKDPVSVLAQLLGEITHAGIASSFVDPMK